MALRFEKTGGDWRVWAGTHALGTVTKSAGGNLWRCLSVTRSTAELPEGFWATRRAAGEALLRARDAAVEAYEARQTADRNVPLALLSQIVSYCRQIDGFVRDVEQIGADEFRVSFGSLRMTEDEVYVLNRKGDACFDEKGEVRS